MIAYFSNGTEGSIYEYRYCARCVHNQREDCCPVLLLHSLWNYDQCDVEFEGKDPHGVAAAKKMALDVLIPRTQDGLGNEECRMFAPLLSLAGGGAGERGEGW